LSVCPSVCHQSPRRGARLVRSERPPASRLEAEVNVERIAKSSVERRTTKNHRRPRVPPVLSICRSRSSLASARARFVCLLTRYSSLIGPSSSVLSRYSGCRLVWVNCRSCPFRRQQSVSVEAARAQSVGRPSKLGTNPCPLPSSGPTCRLSARAICPSLTRPCRYL
jgi:hypothetical protein